MKNELLGKDEEYRRKRNSLCVDLTTSALKQYNRGEGQESAFKVVVLDATKDAYDQGAKELDRVNVLLDECEKMLWTYQNVGGAERRYRLQSLLHKLKGGV